MTEQFVYARTAAPTARKRPPKETSVVPAAPVAWAGAEALADAALDADAAMLERAEAADLDADAAGEPVETVALPPGTTGATGLGRGTTGTTLETAA
jgi:hypothetical protein